MERGTRVTDKAQEILAISALTLVVALLILTIVIVIRRDLAKARQSIADLPPSPEGTERIVSVLEIEHEMTRQHVSATMGSLAHETEMNKGLLYEVRNLYHVLVSTLISLVTPREPKK